MAAKTIKSDNQVLYVYEVFLKKNFLKETKEHGK